MRIALNTPDPQAATTEKTRKSSGTAGSIGTTAPKGKQDTTADRVSLSDLATQALETPEVRQDKVEALRQSISNGQYQLDSEESAEAMLRQ